MSFTHTVVTGYSTGTEGQLTSGAVSITADSQRDFHGSIAGSPTVNVEVDWAITVANLKSILLLSDKALTIYTNAASTGAPQDTIALAAGVAVVWNGGAALFAGNVTKLFVTVTGAAAANLKIRALLDQTP